jgi:hypothetical protein
MGRSDIDDLMHWECSVVKLLHRRARFLRRLVSKDPRKDICTIVYLFAVIACFEIGEEEVMDAVNPRGRSAVDYCLWVLCCGAQQAGSSSGCLR